MRITRAILVAAPLGAGCGDGQAAADAAPGLDAGPCNVPAAGYGDVGMIEMASAARVFDMGDERIRWIGTLEPGIATPDVLEVGLFAGFGAFESAAIAPGIYEIAGREIQYASCGVCVTLHGDYLSPGRQLLMAQSGTLDITELGPSGAGAFRATFTDATFVRVSIDPATSESTIIDDGCATSLGSADWNTPIAE